MPPIVPIALTEQDDVVAVDSSDHQGENSVSVSPGPTGIDNSTLVDYLLGFPSPSDSDASAVQNHRIDRERGWGPMYAASMPWNCEHCPS